MLQLAAILLFVMGIAHSWLGERYILIRLFRRDNLPKLFGGTDFTTGTLRFVWHLTTVAWWGIAFLILSSSSAPLETDFVLRVFSVVAFVSGCFPLVITRGRHLSWAVFYLIATLLWLGAGG